MLLRRYSLAYETLHGNSVNQILKDNGRDSFYVPSPTVGLDDISERNRH